ncbi:MAG: cation transporter [Alphaproteobacteria bacterium]|nr:cation transporter [Alphaproteobacteria bacterium]
MARHSSQFVVLAALVGNGLIAVAKYAAAWLTGSSAMLSEAIHSTVDSGNEILLMVGLARAKRPPDDVHPFGYGMEVYFWTFMVAVLIFGVGAGVSILEGIDKVRHPHPIDHVLVSFAVLGVAFVLDGISWVIALRRLQSESDKHGILETAQRSKDPTVFAVLAEDTAALIGLAIAALGIGLGVALDLPALDGVASIAIGVVLAATAILLARECLSLLTGEAALPELRRSVRRIAMSEPGVLGISEFATLQFGPQSVIVMLSLEFADSFAADDVERAVAAIEGRIKEAHPDVARVFIEAQAREKVDGTA